MYRLGAAAARGLDDRRDVEIAVARRRRPDRPGLVGQLDMQRVGIGLGIDRDRRDPEPPRGADHPAGDLAAIGDQDLGEHTLHIRKTPKRGPRRRTDRRVEARGNRQRQDQAGVGRVDDAVVPEPRAGVIGVALGLVLGADRRLELLLLAPLQSWPRAAMPSRRTGASTAAACSPPITEMRAFGHIHRKRGA